MAAFIKHSPCPSCGSRDNLAVYDDGSKWCFGCHYYIPPKHVSVASLGKVKNTLDTTCLPLPDDADIAFSEQAMEWLGQYGLSTTEIIRHNIVYSKSYDQIIYKFLDGEGRVIAWQARNLQKDRKKYFTSGELNSLLPVYRCSSPTFKDTVVLVEDCVSAIKISPLSDSMPCLGSGVPRAKINRVARLYGTVLVWLDGNMYPNAVKIAKQFQLLGCKAEPIYTELDPKEYSRDKIYEIISEKA